LVGGAVAGDAFQRVDPAEADIEAYVAELADRGGVQLPNVGVPVRAADFGVGLAGFVKWEAATDVGLA